jgi:hypothetical protein
MLPPLHRSSIEKPVGFFPHDPNVVLKVHGAIRTRVLVMWVRGKRILLSVLTSDPSLKPGASLSLNCGHRFGSNVLELDSDLVVLTRTTLVAESMRTYDHATMLNRTNGAPATLVDLPVPTDSEVLPRVVPPAPARGKTHVKLLERTNVQQGFEMRLVLWTTDLGVMTRCVMDDAPIRWIWRPDDRIEPVSGRNRTPCGTADDVKVHLYLTGFSASV